MASYNAILLYILDKLSGLYNAWISLLVSLFFGQKTKFPVHDLSGAILVTGANSGIGQDVTRALIEKGYTVFAGMRDMKQHKDLLSTLPPNKAHQLIPLHLDVTSPNLIEKAIKSLQLRLNGLVLIGIIHCAGSSAIGPLECTSKEDLVSVFEVNTIGPLMVTRACLPLLRESQGRVIFLSSVSGWTPNPLNAPFSASKMALETMADTLRVELNPWGISVSLIEPGIMDTPLFTKNLTETLSLEESLSRKDYELYQPLIHSMTTILSDTRPLSVSYTTRSILDALFSPRPRTRYYVGWDARATWFLRSFLPDRFLDSLFLAMVPSTTSILDTEEGQEDWKEDGRKLDETLENRLFWLKKDEGSSSLNFKVIR